MQIYLEEICGWYALPKVFDFTGLAYFTCHYEGKKLFQNVDRGPYRQGDVFLFGPTGLRDFHKLHAAVFVGEYDDSGMPLLLHASNNKILGKKGLSKQERGGVFLNPLDQIMNTQSFALLYGVRRLL